MVKTSVNKIKHNVKIVKILETEVNCIKAWNIDLKIN